MRIQKRPTFRATAGITFDSWAAGCEAVRTIVQAKLWPANLRILDPVEADAPQGSTARTALVIVGVRVGRAHASGTHRARPSRSRCACGGTIDDDEHERRRRRRRADRTRGAR